MSSSQGRLYLVPTPIGNLGDMTPRALEVLAEVDLVACEDTRTSGRLLQRFDLKKKLISYHDFNESSRAEQIKAIIAEGKSVAVVTDAGSPGISDPAYRVVRSAIDAGIAVEALPGACAIIPAVTASGLPTDRFFYEGFLPYKSAQRRRRLEALKDFEHTLVFYESPHRVAKTLADMHDVLGKRQACMAREISKLHEEYRRGTLAELCEHIQGRSIKGEIVLVVAGCTHRPKEGDGSAED